MATKSNAAMRKKTPFHVSLFLCRDTIAALLRDAETANIPFMDGTGGRIASLCRICVASHTALDTPSTASPQHRPKRDINNFRIPKRCGTCRIRQVDLYILFIASQPEKIVAFRKFIWEQYA